MDGATGEQGRCEMTMTPSTMARARAPSALVAIGLTVLAGLLYVLGYALSKSLVTGNGLSPLQVTFLRCAVILVVGMCAAAWPGSPLTWRRLMRPDKAWEQRAAAAALVASNALAVLAYALMPVTAASALGFTAPLMLTLLSGLLLRERVPSGRWLGTLLGFAGMLLIVRPSGEGSALGIAAAFGGAVTYTLYQVLIRRLRDAATTLDTILQVALVGVVLLVVPVAADWRPVSSGAAALVLLVTVVQTAALACIAAALHRGEASRLAPWQFSGLLWAMALDAVLLHAVPTYGGLVGGALVIGGGVLAQMAGRSRTAGAPSP
ncbi:DMT family transporter [Methylobacterium nonmethylotrophicum]|uniref:DMT family transporter n=1 Tax=Methylobacterium nonmethylotrophicum TaxID=1141884 RepID=A0A4Z0NTS2_9HYPH|nr:DMT family transporter [Methylobacterium nonmethylotrophicum]TGD99646.1 DMT family transporter [Methylobacterium nonmethylotrophicum]